MRTRFDLMKPDGERQVAAKQAMQKMAHDKRARTRELTVGQEIMARNYRDGDKWMPGIVVERKGPLSYIVKMKSGALWRRHIDQLRELVGAATTNAKPATMTTEEASSFPYDIGEPDCDPEPETNGENGDDAPPEEPSEAQLRSQTNHLRNLNRKWLDVIHHELVTHQLCMVMDLCTIVLFLVDVRNFLFKCVGNVMYVCSNYLYVQYYCMYCACAVLEKTS